MTDLPRLSNCLISWCSDQLMMARSTSSSLACKKSDCNTLASVDSSRLYSAGHWEICQYRVLIISTYDGLCNTTSWMESKLDIA